MKRRCPGMDPAYFKMEDITSQECTTCGTALEFWKDDVFLICPECKTKNTNARIRNTCLAWCKEASQCLGGKDIEEWLRIHKKQDRS